MSGFYVNRQGTLEYLTAPGLEGTAHCFSTRFGGVSEGSLASLNLGVHRDDSPGNVLENYRILGEAVGFDPKNTVFTRQLHTDIVERVGKRDCGRGLIVPVDHACDGLVTNEPDVVLTVFSADCTPVLLYDPVARAVGAVHAGWRGTAAAIAAKAVEKMVAEFGSRPENIRAAIGPNIAQCHFETDGDVPAALRDALGAQVEPFISWNGQKYHIDLKSVNALWLQNAGVRSIDICPDCTYCLPDLYWSHRRPGLRRGEQAAVICLKGEGTR